ncbi:hypothetical protein HNO88_003700 [Novosphingobium chloroacetimidivorans]|uniref:Uncharacterized protein n=1 Tax=Novosphingobium chloroacetimidivorans TaxID=1428314 RepID=A0A7W7KCN0_9SPHN|nr:hypothetical protein [Novosphingobium chloroacetimidivorans]MBB4860357.1 hypothetical protein [Novosphingobium chloroacetimidivorans]
MTIQAALKEFDAAPLRSGTRGVGSAAHLSHHLGEQFTIDHSGSDGIGDLTLPDVNGSED